jgi:hypothetical protein
MSFSTSAALSFDDDFIAPDISAGKAPVNCVKGDWENDGGCDENTGVQVEKRQITPAKHGGTCEVSADKIDDEGFQRQNVNCRVTCKGDPDANWSEWRDCTVDGQSCGQTGIEYSYFQEDPAQDPARIKGLVDECPATQERPCYTAECLEPPDAPPIGTFVSCSSGDQDGAGWAHLYTGGDELRKGRTNEIILSWYPNYIPGTNPYVNCDLYTKGPDLPMKDGAYPEGTSIQCIGNDPRGDPASVYRYTNNQIRWYPNKGIAKSWNSNWNKDIKNINCMGISHGADMPANSSYSPTNTSQTGTNAAPVSSSGFCDRRLKDDIKKIGEYEDLNVYIWRWNEVAMTTYGYMGMQVGFMSDELDREYIDVDVYGYDFIKNGTKISEALENVRKLFPAT